MKKNLFCMWLSLLAILFYVNAEAQMTVGGKKPPEPFSVLELLNKGGLRLPQMTTAERNAFAVKSNDKANGLTIYNSTTNCVEYWNKARWVSMCEGDSQATIGPAPCVGIAPDGTGCDSTFKIEDPDCPNGPFTISIGVGSDYATLKDVDNVNGSFKISFLPNETVSVRTALVRVTSTCSSLYKEFLFTQNGVDCNSVSYPIPAVSASSLTLCAGGAVYLSVPANTPNIDKLIWTRNGLEVGRGTPYFVATQKGKYNVSMGAVGCNTNASNERIITESGSVAPSNITVLASNNGVICGTNSVTLSVSNPGSNTVVWYHNGLEKMTGTTVTVSGDSSLGEWFAVVKEGSCNSKQSNVLNLTKGAATGQVPLNSADVLVNGVQLANFTTFCAGGSLDLSVANKVAGVSYTWYNGSTVITSNPYIIPSSQSTISLRMIATDNSGARCSAESNVLDKNIISSGAPGQPTITGSSTLCDGTADLTIVPAASGTYTYTWYKDGVKMAETTPMITVNEPGVTYTASVTNSTGCTSTLATKTISPNVSSLPKLSWTSGLPATGITTVNYGSVLTVQTGIEFGPATKYTWTISKGTLVGSGASVSITFPTSGTDGDISTITVIAENSCGMSEKLTATVTMNNTCPTPVIVPLVATTHNITAGSTAILGVAIGSGGVSPSYKWYTNTSASTTGGSLISGANSSSYNYKPSSVGTYYLYCVVTNGCVGNKTATSPLFTVVVEVNPETIPAGAGTFGGKTCFDIAESNDGPTCGSLSTRQLLKSDFNLTATNTQTYTFNPVGSVSKVRFQYVESVGGAIVSSLKINGNPPALNVSGAVTATLVYKSSLSSNGGVVGAAKGKSTADALSVDVYVIYNNKADGTGTDVALKLTAKIQDCRCCGAKIAPDVWKEFMCYNLGAKNQNLDPLTPDVGLVGGYYSGGGSTPGDTSNQTNPYAWADASGKKTANDPCPAGYRLPTKAEWAGVIQNNAGKPVGVAGDLGKGGYLFGDSLMLPNAGSFDTDKTEASLLAANGTGYFASSYSTDVYLYWWWYMKGFDTLTFKPADSTAQMFLIESGSKVTGNIRCISEK